MHCIKKGDNDEEQCTVCSLFVGFGQGGPTDMKGYIDTKIIFLKYQLLAAVQSKIQFRRKEYGRGSKCSCS